MRSIEEIAKLIKSLCDSKNITVNKMLVESDAGARTYHNMIAGSHPSVDKMAKIADYFDFSIDYLVGRTDNPLSHKIPYEAKPPVSPSDTTEMKEAAYSFKTTSAPDDDNDEVITSK